MHLKLAHLYKTKSGKVIEIIHATPNMYKFMGDNKRWYYYNGEAVVGRDDLVSEHE